jgi:prevent-host-death family protein
MYMLMYTDDVAQRYSIADARTSLPSIVDQAEAGQTIELTRRGKPVAVVVSLREFERLRGDRPQFAALYKAFLAKHSLADVGLDAGFAASARDRKPGRKVSL